MNGLMAILEYVWMKYDDEQLAHIVTWSVICIYRMFVISWIGELRRIRYESCTNSVLEDPLPLFPVPGRSHGPPSVVDICILKASLTFPVIQHPARSIWCNKSLNNEAEWVKVIDFEECRLLGCDAMRLLLEPTFRRNVLLPSSKWRDCASYVSSHYTSVGSYC
jgi:hypothetical protein